MPEPAQASQPEAAATYAVAFKGPRLILREATPADAGRLAEINAVTWGSAYAGLVPAAHLEEMTAARLQARWASRFSDGATERITLVAEIDGVPAGYAVGGPYRVQQDADQSKDTSSWGELFALYMHPLSQGRGAGTALQEALLERLMRRGLTDAALWVLADNERSRRWYAARGWHADGACSQWHGAGVPLEEVRMVRRLDDPEPA